jgi:hypothetical protein
MDMETSTGETTEQMTEQGGEPKGSASGRVGSLAAPVKKSLEKMMGSMKERLTVSDRESETHREGPIALSIEQQTAKLPSDVFLWAALGSIGASAALQLSGRRQLSNFIGQWAPTFLLFGLYNKIVKTMGSDRAGGAARANENDPVRRMVPDGELEPSLH